MALLVVRKLDDAVKEQLRQRAARNGHSMEEVRAIMLAAVQDEAVVDAEDGVGLGTRIARRFANPDEPFALPERRLQPVRPANFDVFEVPRDGDSERAPSCRPWSAGD